MGILIPLVFVIISCLIIWRASDGFTAASDYIGRHLSEGVRGATINAIGSSLPEVFTSFFFLFYLKDTDGFSGGIGTTAGSAIFNGMIIPSFVIMVVIFTGVANKITLTRKVLRRDGASLILAELMFIIIISGNALYWWHGFILMLIYFVYLFYMLKSMKRMPEHHKRRIYEDLHKVEENQTSLMTAFLTFDLERIFIGNNKITTKNAWALLIFSTTAIAFVCLLLVQSCEWIGSPEYTIPYVGTFNGLNIPIMFIAVILASAASSVPDTIISMNDARKGNYDDAFSNALGSNIFDICFAMGFPLFLYTLFYGPIHMHAETIAQSSELRMLLLILTILAYGIYTLRKSLNLIEAYILLGMYFVFTLYVIGRGAENPIALNIAEFLQSIVSFLNIL